MANKMLMVVIIVILGTMATVTDAQATCASQLVPCAPYLNNATIQPQADCCNPIRQAVQNDLACLCNLYSDPTLLKSFNVSINDALRIARACNITTNLSACNAPTSAPPPPPGQPGGDNGGADRIALTGITALFLFLISSALY